MLRILEQNNGVKKKSSYRGKEQPRLTRKTYKRIASKAKKLLKKY